MQDQLDEGTFNAHDDLVQGGANDPLPRRQHPLTADLAQQSLQFQ
jgi:hypothetical protein